MQRLFNLTLAAFLFSLAILTTGAALGGNHGDMLVAIGKTGLVVTIVIMALGIPALSVLKSVFRK